MRELFRPLDGVYLELKGAIKKYSDLGRSQERYQYNMDDVTHNHIELDSIINSSGSDEIQTKVDSAVAEIEKYIKPYIHG